MDHGKIMNRGLSYECRSLHIKALHNLIERSVWKFSLLFVIKWFWPTISNECTGVCCQEILSGLGKWCSHRKDWILAARNNNSKTRHRFLTNSTTTIPARNGRFHFRPQRVDFLRQNRRPSTSRRTQTTHSHLVTAQATSSGIHGNFFE